MKGSGLSLSVGILPLMGEVARRAGGGSDLPLSHTSPSFRFADTSPARRRICI